jgi:membrane-associated PAP2 superfamily phosphatase
MFLLCLGSFFILVWSRRRSRAEGVSLACSCNRGDHFFLRKEIEVSITPSAHMVVSIIFRNGEMLLCSRSDPILLISSMLNRRTALIRTAGGSLHCPWCLSNLGGGGGGGGLLKKKKNKK